MEASSYSRPKPSPLMEVSASKYHFRVDLTIELPGPLPPENSGAHRYVFLLYTQPTSFAPQGDLATPGQPIAAFDVNQYATVSPPPHRLDLNRKQWSDLFRSIRRVDSVPSSRYVYQQPFKELKELIHFCRAPTSPASKVRPPHPPPPLQSTPRRSRRLRVRILGQLAAKRVRRRVPLPRPRALVPALSTLLP